jgi:S1-C subfamily serine protease
MPTAALLALGLARAAPPTAAPAAQAWNRALIELAAHAVEVTALIEAPRSAPRAPALRQLDLDLGLTRPAEPAPPGVSAGAGVLLRGDGLVITNQHVIGGATDVTVRLHDGRALPGRVLAADPGADLALVQIDLPAGHPPLPAARPGPSARAQVGEAVLAVGHPFDFPFTVTTGILSAVDRPAWRPGELGGHLQTDAAMHPGSSGGPLLNLRGEVIGINSAIYAASGGEQGTGLGFAIPADTALRVARELEQRGRASRGALGVDAEDAAPTASGPGGARLTRVLPRGPADAAGLRPGDVILAVDGRPVDGARALRERARAAGAGARLPVTVLRADARLTAVLTTSDAAAPAPLPIDTPPDARLWAGLLLGAPTPERLAAHGRAPAAGGAPGLLVIGVAPGGAGATAGVEVGDLLVMLGPTPLLDPAQLERLPAGQRSAPVEIYRGGARFFAVISGLPE